MCYNIIIQKPEKFLWNLIGAITITSIVYLAHCHLTHSSHTHTHTHPNSFRAHFNNISLLNILLIFRFQSTVRRCSLISFLFFFMIIVFSLTKRNIQMIWNLHVTFVPSRMKRTEGKNWKGKKTSVWKFGKKTFVFEERERDKMLCAVRHQFGRYPKMKKLIHLFRFFQLVNSFSFGVLFCFGLSAD